MITIHMAGLNIGLETETPYVLRACAAFETAAPPDFTGSALSAAHLGASPKRKTASSASKMTSETPARGSIAPKNAPADME